MNQVSIERYFDLAKRLSKKSTHHQQMLGCVIVNHGRVVGVGYNQIKSHPKSSHKYKRIHAEFHALLGVAPADLDGSTVFVYRETKCGNKGLAKPCPSCHKMLLDAGVETVIYTTIEGWESYSN